VSSSALHSHVRWHVILPCCCSMNPRRASTLHQQAFRGDHEPILDVALFAAVQAKLSAQAVERRCRIRGSSALPAGRLFDEQGHRMVPTHTNKKGVRYCYYVSQAALSKQPPGSIGRVPGTYPVGQG
jgi:hypothetical protein